MSLKRRVVLVSSCYTRRWDNAIRDIAVDKVSLPILRGSSARLNRRLKSLASICKHIITILGTAVAGVVPAIRRLYTGRLSIY